jgi:hypothetical protein
MKEHKKEQKEKVKVVEDAEKDILKNEEDI